MSETLEKLRPDRDLQCYFLQPSAIAALSGAGPSGFTVSGTWRQQFDWAVIEWNRDNVFEHPSFRYLPDGDLSGLTLSYLESRESCIPLDSDLYATVDWPSLRVWADPGDGSGEQIYKVPLASHAAPAAGVYQPATVQITLSGTPTAQDYVGFAFLGEHYPYQFFGGDTLDIAVQNLVAGVNKFSPTTRASANGTTITLTYVGAGQTPENSTTGANGNRIGLYTYVSGASTEQWDAPWKQFSGGTSPTQWQITLPFDNLADLKLGAVPVKAVRKLRWTYSADLQTGAFQRTEFQVAVSKWTVTGANQSYSIAGPGSRRIEDDDPSIAYSPDWTNSSGNFSGGGIHFTTTAGRKLTFSYVSAQTHSLYLGTRGCFNGTTAVSVLVDGNPFSFNLLIPDEDVLQRLPLGQFGPGSHTVVVMHNGNNGDYLYFDFVEIAIPAQSIPVNSLEAHLTLATDWDTQHSMALAPERTAWIIHNLGFQGRANHYVGALWFFELVIPGNQYASGTITFTGAPDPNLITEVYINRVGQPDSLKTVLQHLNLIGDTTTTVAKAFEMTINQASTAIRAQASDNVLTIFSRSLGADGNSITIAVSPSTTNLTTQASGSALTGGADGAWTTDQNAMPRINRAARDWCGAYFAALKSYGIDAAASFSTELQFGDASAAAGIAQRYPSGDPVMVNTPALQTNFSPQSVAYWQQVYLDMATVQSGAGLVPFLQFGEVQWWYFPDDKTPGGKPLPGMPFYDAYTAAAFAAKYGHALENIPDNTVDPSTIPQEAAFLPSLIGAYTNQIMSFVAATFPACRFEVLYPADVNDTPLNKVVNYPVPDWTPAKLTCLKTESFGYTFARNLDLAQQSMSTAGGIEHSFPPPQRSHLVGISDATTPWLKEARMAEASGFESVVLWALDQFCLIGYDLPLSNGSRRSAQFG